MIFEHGSGGCLIALVCDMDCQTWLEEHFDDDLLVKIRERGIGGPLPSVMGVNQPALVLFGASADSDVLHFAEVLANHSMYPVIVQPLSENVASNQQHLYVCLNTMTAMTHDDDGPVSRTSVTQASLYTTILAVRGGKEVVEAEYNMARVKEHQMMGNAHGRGVTIFRMMTWVRAVIVMATMGTARIEMKMVCRISMASVTHTRQ